MPTDSARAILLPLIDELAYREGDFTLASGKKSRHYVNTKPVMLDSRGAQSLADWANAQLATFAEAPVAVGGLELGAVPMAAAMVARASTPLRAFIVRKKVKQYGAGLAIEGQLSSGDPVVVLDDVITTGGSTLKAIRTVEEIGCRVVGVLCIVDREEDTVPELAAYDVRSVCTLAEFLAQR